jgi:hypothetical protein
MGIEMRLLLPDREELEVATNKVSEALRLIAIHDPRRFAKLTRDVRRIWVGATYNRGEWLSKLRMCVLRFEYVVSPDTSPARLALILVHEATHARLDRLGCTYAEKDRAEVERICVRAEIALAERLPDGAPLAENARGRLEFGPEMFTDAAFKARGERALKQLGWIGRLVGAIGRAMLWLDRRRAA